MFCGQQIRCFSGTYRPEVEYQEEENKDEKLQEEDAMDEDTELAQYPPGAFTKADLYDRELCRVFKEHHNIQGLTKLAKKGSRFAQAYLGAVYLTGDLRTNPDMEQAGKWLQKAADAGDFEATNTYGQLLLTEELGSPDPIAARKYLTKGSERGNCDAMVALASLLIDGSKPNMAEEEDVAVHPMSNVVNDDTKEGREWLQLASEQGVLDAMLFYSVALAQGIGGPVDEKQARAWHELATTHPDFNERFGVEEDSTEKEGTVVTSGGDTESVASASAVHNVRHGNGPVGN